ncbi:MAG: hypothetical protein ACRDOM_05130 [Nocardioides sp.]
MSIPSWQTLELLEEERLAEPGTDFAVRLLRRFLALCESPRTRAAMLRMVKGSVGSARAGRVLYRVVSRAVVNPVARATGVQASALRLELVASQLIGLAMLRYVLHVEPMASASVDDVVALAAPSIRAALRG